MAMPNKMIVLVDDSQFELAVARDILEEAGYTVAAATSGIEANRYIYGTPRPDLIIIDLLMPMLQGDRKIKLLKQNPTSRDIPVVLASSLAEEELKNAAKDSGADSYLVKPYRKDSLLRRVAQYL